MNVLELAGWKDRRRWASTHGGEWQGPCPSCGGSKRFHVWPYQREGGSYWCRDCGKTGDNIQYLIDFKGMKFKEACEFLRITVPERPSGWRPEPPKKPDFIPRAPQPPAELWQERAGRLVTWAHGGLEKSADVLAWLAARGISAQAARDYGLGWNPGENGKDLFRARAAWGLPEMRRDDGRLRALRIPIGLVIPDIRDGVIHRIRIRRPEGEPRYYVLPGSSMSTMVLGRDRRAFVVVEAELDAIAVMANNRLAGAVGLGSVSARPTAEAVEVLKKALQILVAVDYDQAGAKEMAWWKEHFARCARWPVPLGKDPGEAFAMGMDLEQWIRAGLPPALTIEDVRETKPAPVEKKAAAAETKEDQDEADLLRPETPPLLLELRDLLRKNPAVRIINTPGRFTVLRDGRYVGGRINHLVFREPQVRDYLLGHTAGEIGWENLMQQWRAGHED
jgi:DNA primase